MLRSICPGVVTAAVLFSLVGSAALAGQEGAPTLPAFDVRITFRPEVLNFDNSTPVFVLFSDLSVGGYTDPSNPLNSIDILSPNGDFHGHQENGGGGSESGGYTDFNQLVDTINTKGNWSMTITDGATRSVYSYLFTTTTGSLSQDHLRPITLTSPSPGTISSTPTFEWTQDLAVDPSAEYESAFAVVTSPDYSNYHFETIGPDARSWTPNAVLTPGDYLFYVVTGTYYPGDDLMSASFPTPIGRGGTPGLNSFASDVQTGSEGIFNGFNVVPAPGTIPLACGGAGILARRRRVN